MVREISLLLPVDSSSNGQQVEMTTTTENYPSSPPSLTNLSLSSSPVSSPESSAMSTRSPKALKNVTGDLTVPPLDDTVENAKSTDVFTFDGGCVGCDGVFYKASEAPPSPTHAMTSDCPCYKYGDVHNSTADQLKCERVMRTLARDQSLLSLEEEEDAIEDQQGMNGVLDAGTHYSINQILVEGIIHKKGTGNDWLRSRNWKARWARLVLARLEGYGHVDVPLLCVSWYQKSAANSTVIVLDGTVVIASDKNEKEARKWHHNRFEIRHAITKENSSLPLTRVFTAPSRKARDAWVYAISQALLSYEKEKAAAGKLQKAFSHIHLKPVEHAASERDESWKTANGRYDEFRSETPKMRPQVPLSPRFPGKVGSPAARLRSSKY